MAEHIEKFDVIVVGAGLNGLAAALSFGGRSLQTPLKVALIERGPLTVTGRDTRASAMTAATQDMLTALGVWPRVATQVQDMRDVIVTDSQNPADRVSLLSFVTDKHARAASAMVENSALRAALLAEIKESPGITVVDGAVMDAVRFGPGLAEIRLGGGLVFKAELIAAADGRQSTLRSQAGIDVTERDYKQSALAFTVAHELPHHGLAEEHFTPQGVFAILPLTGNRASIVWTESPQKALRLSALGQEEFASELVTQFGPHRGKLNVEGKVSVLPLKLLLAQSFTAPRLALIGDAAHVIHPLAGLGLNLGFKDVAVLAEAVHHAAALGEDTGGAKVLQTYERGRRFDTLITMAMIEGLQRLFGSHNEAVCLVRGMGLKAVDQMPVVKSLIMKEASGKLGWQPDHPF